VFCKVCASKQVQGFEFLAVAGSGVQTALPSPSYHNWRRNKTAGMRAGDGNFRQLIDIILP